MRRLTNIDLASFRAFLSRNGCRLVSTSGGHEKWYKEGLSRPVIIQTHVDPVPVFVVKNALRTLGLTREDI